MDQRTATNWPLTRSVLILGGATANGIGAAIREKLAIMGHRTFAPPQSELDVTQDYRYSGIMDLLEETRPDSVVYSVGINELDWSVALDHFIFARLMDANVWGFINVLKALQLTKRTHSVLAITSDAAVRPMRTSMAYCASKAALNMVIRVASRELAAEGWRINGLAPGKVQGTEMTRYVDDRVMEIRHFETREEASAYEMAGNPMLRPLTTAEIATVACDVLLSNSLGWTGDIVTVNGGR